MSSTARVCNANGDCTDFFWSTDTFDPTHFNIMAVYNTDQVLAFNWPLNSTLTLTVDHPDTPANPDV